MNSKVLFLLCLLSIWNSSLAVENCLNEEKFYFHCIDNREDVAIVSGMEIECSRNTICNSNKKKEDGTKCQPCVTAAVNCKDLLTASNFKCVGDSKFEIDDKPYNCPAHTECVDDPTAQNTCYPCVKQKCNSDLWTCLGDNVVTNGVQGKCAIGFQCNINYIYPCTPCIVGNSSIVYANAARKVEIASGSFTLLATLITLTNIF